MTPYDIVIVGGGPGGEAAAMRARRHGKSVCLIERGALGGTCLNVGCIPTKAILHASELFWTLARRGGELGLAADNPRVDGGAFMKRVGETVATIRRGLQTKLKNAGVTVLAGQGRFLDPHRLCVTDAQGQAQQVVGQSIILATGSAAGRPAMFPWASPRVITTDEATTAATLPASVLVVGGGVIGCEFATAYAELGIPVTLVEMLDRLCPTLDEVCSRYVTRSLGQRGVTVCTAARIDRLDAADTGVTAWLADGRELQAQTALIAVGRRPVTDALSLEAAGVELSDGRVNVDDRCRTNVPHIYAVGDVAERLQYAHLAARMGVVAADNAAGLDTRDDRSIVPVGLFAHPEIASVGLSESQALAACPAAIVHSQPCRASGTAWAYGEKEGEVRLVGDGATGRLLGATIVGYRAADLIAELTVAMRQGLTLDQIAQTIHVHPSFAEIVAQAAEAWCDKAAARAGA